MITLYTPEKSSSVNGLKVTNLRSIMCCFLCDGAQTKMDLMLSTGLSSSTVSDVINCLAAAKIVYEKGSEQSSGGRRPIIYCIQPDAAYMVGCSIGCGYVDAAVNDLTGKTIYTNKILLHKKTMLDMLYKAVEWAQEAAPGPIKTIGIGVLGHVQWKTGVVLKDGGCGWHNVPLKELMERRYGVPTCVDHRVNARSVAEAFLGAARHIDNFICLYKDAPEKAALVSDGTLIHGNSGGAGRYQGNVEILLSLMDAEILVSDRQDLSLYKVTPAMRTGENFAPDCAVMAEIYWFDLLYDYLREADKWKNI